jgi:muramoyltetrapeptide carboxypeptidase
MILTKLRSGSHVRVIATSQNSERGISNEVKRKAIKGLEKLGLKVSFGKYVEERLPVTKEQRAKDLHDAISDPDVQAIMPLAGGAKVEELLELLDFELIKSNPKMFIGMSGISELSFALLAKTGFVNYYGPNFSMLGSVSSGEELLQAMKEILMVDATIRLYPSRQYHNYANRSGHLPEEERIWGLNGGTALGKCIGGNYFNLDLLLGSQFMPSLTGAVVFIEDNGQLSLSGDAKPALESVVNDLCSQGVSGLMFGQFGEDSGITREWLTNLVKSKKELSDVPVVANVDFGQEASKLTLPIGGMLRLEVKGQEVKIDAIR